MRVRSAFILRDTQIGSLKDTQRRSGHAQRVPGANCSGMTGHRRVVVFE